MAGLLYLGAGIGVVVHIARGVLGIPALEAALRRHDIPWLVAVALFGGVVGPLLLMLGLSRTSASSGSLLLNLEGLATMAIAWVVFRDNVDRQLLLGAFAILAGAMAEACCGSTKTCSGSLQAHSLGRHCNQRRDVLTEMVAGQLAGSQALKADALDFLADTVTYGLSLVVIGASLRQRATAALFKGLSLSLMALRVFASTIYHTLILGLPSAELMGGIGLLALAANLASVLLVMRYKDGDANVRSVWLCSRNDAIGNVIVMVAALAVWGTKTAWPDLLVAGIMACLFLTSAVQILRQAFTEYRQGSTPATLNA